MEDKTIKNPDNPKKPPEYSKVALAAMIVLWFIIALFDSGVIVYLLVIGVYDYIQMMMSDLLTYVGAPMLGGIVTYLIKSAVENKQKIKGSHAEFFDSENEGEDGNDA